MKFETTLRVFAIAFGAVVLCSCASQPRRPEQPALVWPPPPSSPRITFVQNVRGPRDIGVTPSFFRTLANWVTGDTGKDLNLKKPFALALDEKGNLCITDTDAKLVCLADFTNKLWRRYSGVGKTDFLSPVAVARNNGILYVADSELARVFAFGDNGKPVFEIAAPLKRPVGLAIIGGSLYVVDSQLHAVYVFGLDGKLQFHFGHRGENAGEFNFPTSITPDNRGHLLVSDTLNSRVQVFDLSGNFVSQFGGNGDTSGHFARPKGVAVDADGHSYIVDALFNNFQIFDAEGRLLLNVGEGGVADGEFSLPHGIAISSDNLIYVADAFNHRVQVFKYLGQP